MEYAENNFPFYDKACVKSSIKSSVFSKPTEILTVALLIPFDARQDSELVAWLICEGISNLESAVPKELFYRTISF